MSCLLNIKPAGMLLYETLKQYSSVDPLTLSLTRVPLKIKIQDESQISFVKY